MACVGPRTEAHSGDGPEVVYFHFSYKAQPLPFYLYNVAVFFGFNHGMSRGRILLFIVPLGKTSEQIRALICILHSRSREEKRFHKI